MHLTHFSLARHTSVGRDRESDPASSSVYTRLLVSSGGMTSANQWEITCQHHQIRPSISMGFWLLHINTSSIARRRTIYTTALGIKSLFTPIILEHPPELYQSSGTLWRWVYATFRFFLHLYSTLIYLFGFVWSYSPSIHPSTPTEEVYGRNKKKYYISSHVAKI